jgi:Na+/melibiose symporter and related transporters
MEKLKDRVTSVFRYGIGMFGTSLAINMFRGRAQAYYVNDPNVTRLTLADLSLILFIYTFLDVIDNPIYGILSDNTRTKFGRRKPWLVLGTPLFALTFILFYAVPDGISHAGIFAWAVIFYFITGTLDSLINANYGALFPELFPDDKKRSKANAVRQTAQLFAMIIGFGLTPIIVPKIGYVWTAVILGIASAAVILYMTFGVREPPAPAEKEKVYFFKALASIVQSKNFWIVGFANAFYSAAMALVMSSTNLYVIYSLGLGSTEETILLVTVILTAVIGVSIWSIFSRKVGPVAIWRTALITLTISFVPLYFANSFVTAILSCVFVGIGFSGVISTMDLLGAKVMDEDFQKHGVRREGIFSSTMGFMNRLSGLFVSAGTYLASVIYQFKNAQDTGANPGAAAKFIISLFPFAMCAIGVVFTFFVNFKHVKQRSEMLEDKQNI